MGETKGSSRPGGRTARTSAAVREACLRLLAARGAQGFGMEDLAKEAGVHKTTLYRRWQSVPEILGELAGQLIARDVPVPDTGSFSGDLTAIADGVAALMRDRVIGPALTALFAAPAAMEPVDTVMKEFWAHRLAGLQPVVDRAIQRGEVPAGTDAELVFESLGAPMYYRLLITRRPVDAAAADRAVRVTLLAAQGGELTR